jgi:Tol biopolymer transport system component
MFHARFGRLVPWIVALGLSACSGSPNGLASSQQAATSLAQKIAFSSTRDTTSCPDPTLAAEIYVMNPDTSERVRLTNTACDHGNGFAAIAPGAPDSPATGSKIVFDRSTRELLPYDDGKLRRVYHSELHVMDQSGNDQTYLTRGSSATWSPDAHWIAFHSGDGEPINPDPGAATSDSDIFVANVDDLLAGVAQPTAITHDAGSVWINEDPSWSPDGQKVVFTRKSATELDSSLTCLGDVLQGVKGGACDYPSGEIWMMNADGSSPVQLTTNDYEERAPSWSPVGTWDGMKFVYKFVYMCRVGGSTCGSSGTERCPFQLCVMNADGSGYAQLTNTARQHLTPSFSPDGNTIIFHIGVIQLWTMHADGTNETPLTSPPGINGFADWGYLKVNPN